MKGYFLVQPVSTFIKPPDPLTVYTEPDFKETYAMRGWIEIEHAIKTGDLLKVCGQRDGIRVDGAFKFQNSIPETDNGNYTIKGGAFDGSGTFRKVTKVDNEDFKQFFICRSNSTSSEPLMWQIGVNEYFDADTVAAEGNETP